MDRQILKIQFELNVFHFATRVLSHYMPRYYFKAVHEK